jgi:arginase family enzyme
VHYRGILDALNSLNDAIAIKERPIYLSIDIDGIDPAYAPGTGTPEPWGLTTWDVLHLMQEIRTNVRAMDVMEVSPTVEQYITPGLASKMLRQMVGFKEMEEKGSTWLEKMF